jgi:hypothetical protein
VNTRPRRPLGFRNAEEGASMARRWSPNSANASPRKVRGTSENRQRVPTSANGKRQVIRRLDRGGAGHELPSGVLHVLRHLISPSLPRDVSHAEMVVMRPEAAHSRPSRRSK